MNTYNRYGIEIQYTTILLVGHVQVGHLLLGDGVAVRLHRREEKHLLDVVVIRQEHGKPVNTESPSAGRRKAILQRGTEVLVHEHGLVVSGSLGARLLLKQLALPDRVIQLRIRVGDLLGVDEQLEPLRHARQVAVPLGQRRHDLRVVADEGGVDALRLEELAHKLVEQPRRGLRRRAVHVVLGAEVHQKQPRLFRVKVLWKLDLEHLLEPRAHRDPPEWRRKVHFVRRTVGTMRMVGHLVPAGDLLDHAGDHLLRHVHQVVVVCVRLIKLAGRKLGVVGHIDPLVPKLLSDLKHPIQTTDDEHLEVEFGRHTHVQLEIQVVMIRNERPSGCSPRNHVHHRRLHLEEPSLVQERAHTLDDLGTRSKDIGHARIHNQVQISLPVPRLLVGQPRVPGNHVQARRQHLQPRREDGQLPTLRLARESLHPDDIPALHRVHQRLEIGQGEPGALKRPRIAHDLHLGPLAHKVKENELGTGRRLAHDTTRHRHLLLQTGARLDVLVLGHILRQLHGLLELVRIRVLALCLLARDVRQATLAVLGGIQRIRLVVLQVGGPAVGGLRLCPGGRLGSHLRLLLCRLLRLLLHLQALLELTLAHLRPILIHQILAVFLGKDELGHGDCCSKIAARALDSGRIFLWAGTYPAQISLYGSRYTKTARV
mmetsp:Transcript_8923/g.24044  ORF Transcript_8923/g.24044 Transcript_8923/m.24044 type:complete len:656 (-) Transcript_8923:29-1996(-)